MAEEAISVKTAVREIRPKTARKNAAEEKIRTVPEDLRAESRIAKLYCREGIHRTRTTSGAKSS